MLGGAAAGGGAPLEKGSFGGAPNGSAPEGAPNGSFGAGAPNPPPLEEAAKGSFIAGAPKGSAPPPPPRSPSKSGPAAVAPGRAPPPPTLAGMPSAGTAVDDSAFGLMTTAGNLPAGCNQLRVSGGNSAAPRATTAATQTAESRGVGRSGAEWGGMHVHVHVRAPLERQLD